MDGKQDIVVFVIEDDPVYLAMLTDFIRERFSRFAIHTFTGGEAAVEALNKRPAVVILDYFLNRKSADTMNGLDVLEQVHERCPHARVVILSAQDDINVSVHMMKYGAYDYIVKNETDVYRLQNTLNHLVTLFDYDRRIRQTRRALAVIGVMLAAVLTYVLSSL